MWIFNTAKSGREGWESLNCGKGCSPKQNISKNERPCYTLRPLAVVARSRKKQPLNCLAQSLRTSASVAWYPVREVFCRASTQPYSLSPAGSEWWIVDRVIWS
jgi:hypothetical protein